MTPTHQQPAMRCPHGSHDRQRLAVPWASRHSAMARTYVHPCVIEGERCFVHERGLEQRDPRVYRQLLRFARETGFRLQEDRRQKNLRVPTNRRRKWALVLAVALCFVSEGEVMASEEHGATAAKALWRTTETSLATRFSSPGIWLRLHGDRAPTAGRARADACNAESEAPCPTSWSGRPDDSTDRLPHESDIGGSSDHLARISYQPPAAVSGEKCRPGQIPCLRSLVVPGREVARKPNEQVAMLGLIPMANQSPGQAGTNRDWVEDSGLFDSDKGTRSPIQETQPGAFQKIRGLLQSHYREKPDDPGYIKGDIDRIAAYYSKFPEVFQLLSSLEGEAWHLSYGKDTWATKASGTCVRVNQATVVFDPRKAAQLRFNRACVGNRRCTASPADALLHEFLHVRTMLLNSQRFIDQGGMGGSLYPYAHEAEVINAENDLYSAMARLDGLARPQRSRHKHLGKLVKASCAVCIN